MVFQSYALFPHMSVLENVSYGLKMINVPKEEFTEKSLETLKLVNLEGYENRMPSELSGGQQQRVAVARAIVLKPKVLLFDEPLSNLDAKLRRQVREDIREIQQKLGVTTIYVTHDQEEALAISDKVIVMNNAIIAQQGSPKELYNFPKTKFVANFIGDANVVKAEIINQNNNIYEIQLAEMKINIESDQKLESSVSVSLRPEKITISKSPEENSIHASVNNASFVGNSYQYIVNSKVGKIYVVSSDTNEIFNVGENVYLKFDEKELRLLDD
jgi:iron(III) transport system ATP-binding protein